MKDTGHERTAEALLLGELRALRGNLPGVHGSLVATSDGLLIAHDLHDVEPTKVAAIVATTLGLAGQAMAATGRGHLREAIAKGAGGCLAVYAAGRTAVIAVIGDGDLNIAMLHYEMRGTIERVSAYSAEFASWASPRPAGYEPAPDP
jgi:predicted regulator of Ras-like GTPase activity (Roadblock/LC7/MglB family)